MKKSIYISCFLFGVGIVVFIIGKSTSSDLEDNKRISEPVRASKRKPLKLPEISLPSLEYTMPLKGDLDEVTQQLVGFDSSLTLSKRNELVWELKNRSLRKEDFRALYTFLKTKPKSDEPQLTLHSLKNDLLVFVIDDGRFKESTAQLMIDVINDPEQHEVMREYSIQYVSDFFKRHWGNSSTDELSNIDQQLQEALLKTMWNMLDNSNGPIAGTSLIQLHDLSKAFPNISSERISLETERMVIDQLVPVSSRMAALSISKERNLHHLKDQISLIAFDETSSLSLRMSALHTVSEMDPDKGFTEKLSKEIINNQDTSKLLKRAAELAIKKLQKIRG